MSKSGPRTESVVLSERIKTKDINLVNCAAYQCTSQYADTCPAVCSRLLCSAASAAQHSSICSVVRVSVAGCLLPWFVFAVFMHYIHIELAQKYLSHCVSTVSAASGRYRLRSTGSAAYVLPRTRTKFDERGFFYSGPAAWNTLPSNLHDITDTSTFRKRLKNVLFDRAYN